MSPPDESYDAATENPDVAARIPTPIAEMLKGFPEQVQQAYADAQARKTAPETPTGGRVPAAGTVG